MKYIFSLLASLFILGCSQSDPTPEAAVPSQPEKSRFHSLDLKDGMNREEVEKQVAVLLGYQNRYGPYGNNLLGGIVHYRDGDWVLEIKYKAGAPAPRFINKDGENQGLPPIDETILDYTIERIPNHELKATVDTAP